MFPIAHFTDAPLGLCNEMLAAWGHKMGPIHRSNQNGWNHALYHNGRPVAVTTANTLIRERVGGTEMDLTRENTVELSRLCAERPGLCRVALRLWREFVFPTLRFRYAISYQDAGLHNGDTYRFDGWKRVGYSNSGTDTRSGRKGRKKYVWLWERNAPAPVSGKGEEDDQIWRMGYIASEVLRKTQPMGYATGGIPPAAGTWTGDPILRST